MDLSSLDSTLPPALADAERDMGDKFRGMFCFRISYEGILVSDARERQRRNDRRVHEEMAARDFRTFIDQ